MLVLQLGRSEPPTLGREATVLLLFSDSTFQHCVLGVSGLIAVTIPDTPTGIKVQIQRERLLEREILFESPSDKAKYAKENDRLLGADDQGLGDGAGGGGLVHRRRTTAESLRHLESGRRDSKMYSGAEEDEEEGRGDNKF